MVATISRPRWRECGVRCHSLFFIIHMMVWITDRTPDMVLPPGEDWDQRGMCCSCLCFVIWIDRIYDICIWMLTLSWCCFADVGPRG
jgi:hypothetical protein